MDAPQNCALGRVTRLSYILSDHFCNPLGVDLIAGKHLPPDTDVTQVKRTFSAVSSCFMHMIFKQLFMQRFIWGIGNIGC